jgi:predicted negative regulator of RcsB-dependent stress response
MKSGSNSSCFGTAFLLIVALVVLRFALPAVWRILELLFVEAFYFGFFVIVILLAVIGYFTYKNLSKNRDRQETRKYARVTRVEELYQSIVERLNRDMVLNQVSAEELLQSEVLIRENLSNLRSEIVRLKDFASPENQKNVSAQMREYQQQLRESKDAAAKEVLEQNLRMVEEKRNRIESALDEVRQKEGMVDLVYNSLMNAEEELKFGRPIQHLFPPDLYQRFGLNPPADQTKLPPLTERSNE